MKLDIKVYLDYICPFCFLTTFSFNAAVKNKDIRVQYIPFEIPELDLNSDLFRKGFWDNILESMAKNLGHKAKMPNISKPHSKLASEAYYFANENGKGREFNTNVYEAFFEKGKDIGKVNVLTEIATEIGLDSHDIKVALENRRYREKHKEEMIKGKEEGISAVPTIVIGDTKIIGYRKKEFFDNVIEEEIEKLNDKNI